MSLQLYVGHSGHALEVDTTRITTLEALRAFTTQHASIQANRQIILTSKGKSARPQSLLTEHELFVFDSSLLTTSASTANLLSSSLTNRHDAAEIIQPLPEAASVPEPPDTITNQTDLASWQALFRSRLIWAQRLREQCAYQAEAAQRAAAQQAVVQRSLSVALESMRMHVRGAEAKQRAAAQWAEELVKDQEARLGGWEGASGLLESVPARLEFARFVQYGGDRKDRVGASGSGVVDPQLGTLRDFMPRAQVDEAASDARTSLVAFRSKVEAINVILGEAKKAAQELLVAADTEHSQSSSMESDAEPTKLLDEIDIILRKITSDDGHVGTLPRTSQSVSQASKMALLHTRNYLPNMREYASEMNDVISKAVQQRNVTAESCLHHMQTLSGVESQLAKLYADIKGLEMPPEDQQALNTLNIVSRLPFAYGTLLIEAVRRREWIDKMKRDSSALAEEMATYQEEEERRRKRWLNSIDDVIEPELVKSKALGIEVNLQAETDIWPTVDRQEVHTYVQTLTKLGLPDEVVQNLGQAARALDQPTRKQIKHAKAFRNGSMHEAAFGSTSLMMRGEDDLKVLREANTKLEDEVRGQKSRVRKLEDLLHRQTASNRAVSGDVFMPQLELISRPDSPSMASRRISEDYRPGSSRSRRTSSNHGQEEKKLARRIVSLEAELHTQRERSASLEKDAQARQEAHETGQAQIAEAISIKKDIMHNMEAQQREFALERRNLEDDLGQARARIEEMEDELDRLLGSRDNERNGVDARVKALQAELSDANATITKNAAERMEKSESLDFLRHTLTTEQERNRLLQEQLRGSVAAQQQAEASVRRLQAAAEDQRQMEQDAYAALANAHHSLAPSDEAPHAFANLVGALEDLAMKSAAHEKDLAEAVAVARAENESLVAQYQSQSTLLARTKEHRGELEDEVSRIKEQVAAETSKAQSLANQLEGERDQLKQLRGKFAEGETGAGALRQRVEQQDIQVGKLSEQLVEARSHVNGLDVELMRVQGKLNAAQTATDKANTLLETRSVRAKELSQRLFAQNARLLRLLESLGFAVSHKDGQMLIERASKVGASTTLTDTSQLLQRTVSLTSPAATRKSSAMAVPASTGMPADRENEQPNLAFLHWTNAASPTAEDALYANLVQQLNLFSTDTFAEALSKRLRDFEYTARKFRLEARNAGTRATKFQHDAQAKLAVRDFKEGDLALFLPTKGKKVGAWAAFNINAPHHFLRERDGMNLKNREWLVARITRVEERVVDLGRSLRSTGVEADNVSSRSIRIGGVGEEGDAQKPTREASERDSILENENPFDLSDGLTWYLVHATEERSGAPTTPGLGKSTVQGSMDTAKAERRLSTLKPAVDSGAVVDADKGVNELKEKLGRSLESRRSSSTSKRSVAAPSAKGVPIPGVTSAASPRLDLGRSPGSENFARSPLAKASLNAAAASGGSGGGLIRQGLALLASSPGGPNVKSKGATPDTGVRPGEEGDAQAALVSRTPPQISPPANTAQHGQPEPTDSPHAIDAAISSAMDEDLRPHTPTKPLSLRHASSPPQSPLYAQPVVNVDSNAPTPSATPGRTAAAATEGSRSVRALRLNLQASPSKTNKVGNANGVGAGKRASDSPIKGGSGTTSQSKRNSGVPGWRSLWNVDYEVGGGGSGA